MKLGKSLNVLRMGKNFVQLKESQNNYKTDHPVDQTVPNGAIASAHNAKKSPKASSVKQKRNERMKKFDIDFETRLQLEQALSKRRKLEKETHLKDIETKQQLPEGEREIGCKVRVTASENDDIGPQSTSARKESSIRPSPKKKDFSVWAGRINTLTTDQSTACIEVNPVLNKPRLFSWPCISPNRAWSLDNLKASSRVDQRYNNGYSGIRNLPTLKLNIFDGNRFKWPELASIFIAAVVYDRYQTQRK